MRELIGDCQSMDSAFPFGRNIREVFFVDDLGALKAPALPRFFIRGYRWPFYGRAVVLGFDRSGKEYSTKLTVDWLSDQIVFP